MATVTESLQTFANRSALVSLLRSELSRYGTEIDYYTDATYHYIVTSYQFSTALNGTGYLWIRVADVSTYANINICLVEGFNSTTHIATNASIWSTNMRLNYNESHNIVTYHSNEVFGVSLGSVSSTYHVPILIFRCKNSSTLGNENDFSWLTFPQSHNGSYFYTLNNKTTYNWATNSSANCFYPNSNSYGSNYINPLTGKVNLDNLWTFQGVLGGTNNRSGIDNIFSEIFIGSDYKIGTKINDGINNYICILRTNNTNAAWIKIT